MKNVVRLGLTLMIFSLVFGACEKIKSIADVKFESEFKTDLDVNIQPTALKAGVDGTFYAEAEIDPLSDDEFSKYADKIKEINVLSAEVEIISLNPTPIQLINATIKFEADGFDGAQWSFNNVNMQAGTKFELDESQWPNIQAILDAKEKFKVSISGQTDVDAGSFKARVYVKSEIVANPLN